jgi:hypothetical protein
MRTRSYFSVLVLILTCATLFGQSNAQALKPEDIVEKATPSVALLLVGSDLSKTDGLASAIVIRENGVLLTAWHVLKDARAVQVRFKNGEIYDDVQLLGVDRRRDVAALKIAATRLPLLPIASAGKMKQGDSILVVAHPEALPWTASMGIVSAYRMADEVPGLGEGYRILQCTAPAAPGSSAGVVLDLYGSAVGLEVGGMSSGHSLNFAVPLENISGLADAPPSKTFASGVALKMPSANLATGTPNATAELERPNTNFPVDKSLRIGSPELSEQLKDSKGRDSLLRSFRTMYISASGAQFFDDNQLKAAMGTNNDFAALKITIVDSRALADVVLDVGYTFAWDYPFTLKHQNTSVVLLAGKGTGPFSGPAGATSVAKELARQLKPYRTDPAPTKGDTKLPSSK